MRGANQQQPWAKPPRGGVSLRIAACVAYNAVMGWNGLVVKMEQTQALEWALLALVHRPRTRRVGRALASEQTPPFSGIPRIEVVLVVARVACTGIGFPLS